jgi:hypothetical protein
MSRALTQVVETHFRSSRRISGCVVNKWLLEWSLAQSEALYLAGCRLGQFIDEIDNMRILKAL